MVKTHHFLAGKVPRYLKVLQRHPDVKKVFPNKAHSFNHRYGAGQFKFNSMTANGLRLRMYHEYGAIELIVSCQNPNNVLNSLRERGLLIDTTPYDARYIGPATPP